jgi:hypothetical protein
VSKFLEHPTGRFQKKYETEIVRWQGKDIVLWKRSGLKDDATLNVLTLSVVH